MKPFFGIIFALLLSVALFSAAPLPTAQAANRAPEELTPADWAQIQSQLDPEPSTSLTEQAKLTASDSAIGDGFGYSVAVNGDTAVIGTPMDDDRGIESGSVYVFTRSGGVWSQQAKLTASDPAADDQFGYSVAIHGDTAVIGAWGDDDGGDASGSAYLFTRSGGVWSQQAKLTASDPAVGDWFGNAVVISGDTAVIGAFGDDNGGEDSGSAYVFTRTGGEWSQQAKLTASDPAAFDEFSYAVAISGDTALIGAYRDDDGSFDSGSAYVFTRTGGEWSQQAKLTASDPAASDWFGLSVAVSGDTAVIGALWDDDGGEASGSAYVFTRTGGEWSQQAKLTASDPAVDDAFGRSVVVNGDMAIIGAFGNNNRGLTDNGSAYVFTRSGGTWNQQAKLTASDAAVGDRFGYSVAMSGDTAVIGTFGGYDFGDYDGDRGAAYIFAPPILQKIYQWLIMQAGY